MQKKSTFLFLTFILLFCSATTKAANNDPETILAVAPPCNLPAPANLQYSQPTPYTVHFSWDSVPGAVGYRSVLINQSNGSQSTNFSAPSNSTYPVIPGDHYLFIVTAACSENPLELSPNTSQAEFQATYIIIDLIAGLEGCTPTGNPLKDVNPDPNVYQIQGDWELDKQYYIELTKMLINGNTEKVRLAFKRKSSVYELRELNNNLEPSLLCGQTTTNPCEPAPDSQNPVEVSNSKFTYGGRTCRIAFSSTGGLYYYVLSNTYPVELPVDNFKVYDTCEGEGGHSIGRSATDQDGNTIDFLDPDLSPNPFTDNLIVHFPEGPTGPVKTRMLDLQGSIRLETVLPPGETTYSLPAENLPAGMYFLQMEVQPGQFITRKVMKL